MQRPKPKPKKQRRFAQVDLEWIEPEHENPDWLVGAN